MQDKKIDHTKPFKNLSRKEKRELRRIQIKERKDLKRNKPNAHACDFERKIQIIDGLRWVVPYDFWFEVVVKERWIGSQVEDVMANEFKYTSEQINQMFLTKKLKIKRNNNEHYENCEIQSGDILMNQIHRHELPVPNELPIIYEDEFIIVVDKPSGIPTHAGGRYTENSVINWLERERKSKLFSVHRLDRLTSGVLVVAKTSEKANEIQRHFSTAHKKYICRVVGNMEGCVVDKKIIETSSITHQKVETGEEGKESITEFEKIFYDENTNTTVVWAKPLTGRMHQIRVHLLSINHPIVNDSLYRNKNEYCIKQEITEEWKEPNCNECLCGIEIPQEMLWLKCVELTVSYDNATKTFISEEPKWSKREYECKKEIEEWDKNHL